MRQLRLVQDQGSGSHAFRNPRSALAEIRGLAATLPLRRPRKRQATAADLSGFEAWLSPPFADRGGGPQPANQESTLPRISRREHFLPPALVPADLAFSCDSVPADA